jgi:hypothetical protein
MNGISGIVSLTKYHILQLLDVRHTYHSFVPQYTLIIFQKSKQLLFIDIMLNLLDLLILLLTSTNLLKYTRTYFHLPDFRISNDS